MLKSKISRKMQILNVNIGLIMAISLLVVYGNALNLNLDIQERIEEHRNISVVPHPKLILLGTVDGKSYFRDDTMEINWTTAKEICDASGLRLASITTTAQLEFLNNEYANGNLIRGEYWLGGRESRLPQMYSWDSTGIEIPAGFSGIRDMLGSDHFACLTYVGVDTQMIHAHPCSLIGNVGALCET